MKISGLKFNYSRFDWSSWVWRSKKKNTDKEYKGTKVVKSFDVASRRELCVYEIDFMYSSLSTK